MKDTISVSQNHERQRQRLFDLIEAIHQHNREVPSEEIESATEQAVAEVRGKRRRQAKAPTSR
jgi:hypothetical protein